VYQCRVIQVELEQERQSVGHPNLFHFFNTFFFKKLTEKSDGPEPDLAKTRVKNHDRVRKWTKVIPPPPGGLRFSQTLP